MSADRESDLFSYELPDNYGGPARALPDTGQPPTNGQDPAPESDGGGGGKPSIATQLTELAEERAELWHDGDGDGWATVPVGEHVEHHRVRSKPFKTWMRRQFYAETRKSPGGQAVQDAVENLAGIAQFAGPERAVYVRVAEHHGNLYLDLADAAWRAVEITTSGWRVVARPPVVFRRRAGMLPLPSPERGGNLDELRRFINVTDDDWPLVKAWLVAAVAPFGPYPVLNLHGGQGAGKTTTQRMLRRLVDPNRAEERDPPRDVRDLMIAASAGHVISFDNLSGLPGWLSDALARLATGAGFATRTLYTDDDETIIAAQRPVIANGIEDVAVRPDLLDRSIVITLGKIDGDARRTERELWAAYEQARPRMLGALLDAVVCGLGRRHQIRPQRLPRMADFSQWAAACAPALNMTIAEFLTLYNGNRAGAQQSAVEASLFGGALVEFMLIRESWQGTSAELLAELTTDERRRSRSWPNSPRGVTGILQRLAPALEEAGITATYHRDAHARRWTLDKTQ